MKRDDADIADRVVKAQRFLDDLVDVDPAEIVDCDSRRVAEYVRSGAEREMPPPSFNNFANAAGGN